MTRFLRFLLVGVFNTCFGYGLIFGFMYLAELSPELSNFLGYAIALMVSFVLNKTFTFAHKTREPGEVSAELLRFLTVFACAYAINYAVLVLLLRVAEVHVVLSQLGAGVAYVLVSYFLNARFVFRR